MTVFVGRSFPAVLSGLLPGVALQDGEAPPTVWSGLRPTDRVCSGVDADGIWQHQVAVAHWPGSAAAHPPNTIWDQTIITPPRSDYGQVMSRKAFQLEVWNTHRGAAETLTGIALAGNGGMEIEDPEFPVRFEPGESFTYSGTVPQLGSVKIADVATFTFTGLDAVAFAVTGTRLTVCAVRPDWSDPFTETISYKTSIVTADDTSEQRRSLRSIPRYGASYRISGLSARESAWLENLVYGCQPLVWGVPWWPERMPLLADASAGDQVLAVSTANLPTFEVGALVMVWVDFWTWEAATITAVASGSVTIDTPLVSDWAAGVWVVPMRPGQLSTSVQLVGPTNWIHAGTFEFVCEAHQ
nr:hypothetical protein [uncultured Holophaga sp.]